MSTTVRLACAVGLAFCACPPLASAGVIHGIVVEHSSSRPLARAGVKLEALSGTRLELVSTVLANRSGQFSFLSLPDGYYVLSAICSGYNVATHGQNRPNAMGRPIMVSRDSVTFVEMRLQSWTRSREESSTRTASVCRV